MDTRNLPLSPHLTIYRPQITSLLSMTHRATGIFLSIGILLLVYWLLALAAGPGPYRLAAQILGSVPGKIALMAWTLSLYFHLFNGIRHLFWDAGYGFELTTLTKSGLAVIAATAVFTVATWWLALGSAGSA